MRSQAKASVRPIGGGLLATAALLCLFWLVAAPAQAAPGYQQVGSGIGVGMLRELPVSVAVDDATGNVLVVSSPTKSVMVFDSAGTLLTEFAPHGVLGPTGSTLQSPYGIAVDQSNGDVYVSYEELRILRWVSDGANPPTYSIDPTYAGPAYAAHTTSRPNGEMESFNNKLAVDPRNGDLVLTEPLGKTINRYTSDGTFVSKFDGRDTAKGVFSNPLDLAVAPSGEIYAINVDGFIEDFEQSFVGNSTSRIERFSPTGASLGTVAGKAATHAVSIAYDPSAENVVFGSQYGVFSGRPSELSVVHDGVVVAEIPFEGVGSAAVPGLAATPASGGKVYALTGGFFQTNSVQVFEPRLFPDLAAPAPITTTGATVSGTVYPSGEATKYWFEYRAVGAEAWTSTPEEDAGAGMEAAVSTSIAGLEPNREYQVRLVSKNASGEIRAGARYFSTLIAPPLAVTGDYTEITQSSAYLRGNVTPFGAQSTYHFEYGLTSAYGDSVPVGAGDVAGGGRSPFGVGHKVEGLQPGTTYHYRLVAENAAGPGFGEDRTFTTRPAAPARAYEMVTPAEKANVSVAKEDSTMPLVRADGESIVFSTEKASYPGSESTVYFPRYRSQRTADGWTTTSADPPVNNSQPNELRFFGTSAYSEDQSRALVSSNRKLAPGAIESMNGTEVNLYIRDLEDGSYTFMAAGNITQFELNGPARFVGASADLSTVVFYGTGKLLGDGVPEASAKGNLYEWQEGHGVRLVSAAPDGTPLEIPQPNFSGLHEPNQVSRDGSKTYFSAYESGQAPDEEAAYLYTRGAASTKLISVSHRPGDPATPVPGAVLGASPDGQYAVFVVTKGTAPLTTDAPVASGNAYLYDDATGSLKYLASEVAVNTAKAFFDSSPGDLVFERIGGGLEYAHDGVVIQIVSDEAQPRNLYTYSPNGRYYLFAANGKVGSFDNEGFTEVYRYDTVADELTCVSCRSDGGKPTGDARFGILDTQSLEFQHHPPQSALNNGTVYFDTPDPLLPADVNGTRDVYAYEGGQLTLISPGDDEANAEFVGADPDGTNVFIKTTQPLVAQDLDQAVDIYDARVGGGIPSQNEPPSRGCESEDCRTTYAVPAPFRPLGSEGIDQADKPKARGKARCAKGQRQVKQRGKSRCVKQRKARHPKHRAGKSGRAGR